MSYLITHASMFALTAVVTTKCGNSVCVRYLPSETIPETNRNTIRNMGRIRKAYGSDVSDIYFNMRHALSQEPNFFRKFNRGEIAKFDIRDSRLTKTQRNFLHFVIYIDRGLAREGDNRDEHNRVCEWLIDFLFKS